MKRVDILCPNCFKKKLLQENPKSKDLYCDGCGQEFIKIGENSVRYK